MPLSVSKNQKSTPVGGTWVFRKVTTALAAGSYSEELFALEDGVIVLGGFTRTLTAAAGTGTAVAVINLKNSGGDVKLNTGANVNLKTAPPNGVIFDTAVAHGVETVPASGAKTVKVTADVTIGAGGISTAGVFLVALQVARLQYDVGRDIDRID